MTRSASATAVSDRFSVQRVVSLSSGAYKDYKAYRTRVIVGVDLNHRSPGYEPGGMDLATLPRFGWVTPRFLYFCGFFGITEVCYVSHFLGGIHASLISRHGHVSGMNRAGGHTHIGKEASQKINLWEAYLANLDPETAEIYGRAVRMFCEHLGYTVEAAAERAKPDDIVSFAALLKNKGLASGTIRLYLGGVKKFYEACELPYSAVKLKLVAPKRRVEKETNEIPKPLAKEIVLAAPPGKKALFHFLWATGVRIGEALALRKRDISLGETPKAMIRTEKTGRLRYVFLPPDLVARLRPRLKGLGDDELAFSTMHDRRRPLNPNKVGALFRLLLLRGGHLAKDSGGRGYTLTLHSFRRSYETNLVRAGVHPMVIKFLLGHSQGAEDHYLRLDEKTLYNEWKKAERLLRLDADVEVDERVASLERQVEVLAQMVRTMAGDLLAALAEGPAREKSQLSAERLGADLVAIARRIGPEKVEPGDLRELLLALGGIYGRIKKS